MHRSHPLPTRPQHPTCIRDSRQTIRSRVQIISASQGLTVQATTSPPPQLRQLPCHPGHAASAVRLPPENLNFAQRAEHAVYSVLRYMKTWCNFWSRVKIIGIRRSVRLQRMGIVGKQSQSDEAMRLDGEGQCLSGTQCTCVCSLEVPGSDAREKKPRLSQVEELKRETAA